MKTRILWIVALASTVTLLACGDDDDGGGNAGGTDDTGMSDDASMDAGNEDTGGSDAGDDGGGDDTAPDVGPMGRPDLEWAPGERGPYQVGFQELSLTYTVPATDEERTIPVFMWYPTDETEGINPPGASLLGIAPQPEVWQDAEPRPPTTEDGYPVLAYSHGHRAWGENAWQMMRHFASHGWIAVSAEHVLNTISDDDLAPAWIHAARVFDVSSAIDLVGEVTADFPGDAMIDQVVVAGHSRGGFTTWSIAGATFDADGVAEVCAEEDRFFTTCTEEQAAVYTDGLGDDRVAGIIPMDGGPGAPWHGDDGWYSVDVPVMQMGANNNQRDTFDGFIANGGTSAWAGLDGACHEAFTIGSSTDISGCEATLADEDGFLIVNTYALAFARWVLLADETETTLGILQGDNDVHPAVSYEQALFE